MGLEGMGTLFGYKRLEITCGQEELAEVGSVSVEVIKVAANLPPLDGQRK